MRRVAASVVALIAALGYVTAYADGEAGLVIQNGDAVTTYCVPFTGDGIDGDDLLTAAGVDFDQFGGGGGRTLCSIRDVGCFNAGTFNDCFCQCSGGASCTYWAFFTQRYGAAWVYSAFAFNLSRAKDGDLHGWKWGRGNLQSAPVPASISFEQVCGGPPRSLVTATATPTLAPQRTATPTNPPTATGVTATATVSAAAPASSPSAGASTASEASPRPPSSLTPETASPTATPFTALPADGATASVTVGSLGTPGAPATGGDQRGSSGGVIAFGVIAATLIAGTAIALVWRRTRG
ncbi:MAG: hypothetical protein ACKVVT_05955 [Dehalococcoidia bacterium]